MTTDQREDGEPDKQKQKRQQHVIEPRQPGGETDNAQQQYEQRRKAADRRYCRPDDACADERAILHPPVVSTRRAGYPTFAVAAVSAATSAFASSKITMAVF